jgi:hypothetical protein
MLSDSTRAEPNVELRSDPRKAPSSALAPPDPRPPPRAPGWSLVGCLSAAAHGVLRAFVTVAPSSCFAALITPSPSLALQGRLPLRRCTRRLALTAPAPWPTQLAPPLLTVACLSLPVDPLRHLSDSVTDPRYSCPTRSSVTASRGCHASFSVACLSLRCASLRLRHLCAVWPGRPLGRAGPPR